MFQHDISYVRHPCIGHGIRCSWLLLLTPKTCDMKFTEFELVHVIRILLCWCQHTIPNVVEEVLPSLVMLGALDVKMLLEQKINIKHIGEDATADANARANRIRLC